MRRWLKRLAVPGGLLSLAGLVAMTQPLGSSCSGTALAATTLPSGPVSAKSIGLYFEQNGFSPNASAGIVGNMVQESGLNPSALGGGLVQNLGSMYSQQVAFDQAHGLNPSSAQGQLAFIVDFVKRQSWFNQFNSASTPQDAALWFQDNYEHCSGAGAPGTDQVGGGLCNPQHRMDAAAAALGTMGGGGAAFVSTSGCGAMVGPGGATDPAPGATWKRLDMGFDGNYSMTKGAVAPYNGTVRIPGIGGWPGQGVYFYVVNDDQTGPDYTRAMYFAEGATPIVPNGSHVSAGQRIGSPVASGGNGSPGNFEIGPASTTTGDCLAKQYGLGSSAARTEIMAFYAWMRTLGAGVSTNISKAGAP